MCGLQHSKTDVTNTIIHSKAKFSASSTSKSSTGIRFSPEFARFGSEGAWMPSADDICPWLQVDLGDVMVIHSVITRVPSVRDSVIRALSATFRITYGNDGVEFRYIKNDVNVIMTFVIANVDADVINKFPQSITARYIRIMQETRSFPLKLDLAGCRNGIPFPGEL